MEYRVLLAVIDKVSRQNAQFSSKQLARIISEEYSVNSRPADIKTVSNDLARLYRMQLLSRKRVRRPVRGGDENRGYMYLYSPNKQGRQYIEHLKETWFSPEIQNHFKSFHLWTTPNSAIPLRDIEEKVGKRHDFLDEAYAEQVYLHKQSKKGRRNRFPPKIPFERFDDAVKRVHKLEEEKDELKADLERARKELRLLKSNMFYSVMFGSRWWNTVPFPLW